MSKSRNTRPRLELQSTLVRDDMPFQVVPGLFIGSIYASLNEEGLRQHGITHILNASRCPSTFPNSFTYLAIDIRDNGAANILSCIPVSNIFIESGMDHGGVLVHCYGGRSRSAALIAAFLMSSMNLNYDEVLPYIIQARPMTAINSGFQQSLRAYGSSGYDVYRAQQVLLKHRLQVLRELRENNLKRLLLQNNDAKYSSETDRQMDMKMCDRNKRDRSPRPDSASGNSINNSGSNNINSINNGVDTAMDIETDAREAATSILRGMNNSSSSSSSSSSNNNNALPDERDKNYNNNNNSSNSNNGFPVPPRPSQLLSMRSPPLRLSRPSSTSIRVIPPLRGLDRQYCCSWPGCGTKLFCLVNVVRTNDFENNTNDNSSKNCNGNNNFSMERSSADDINSHGLPLSLSAESKNNDNDSNNSSSGSGSVSGSKMHSRDTDREAMEKRLVQMDIEDGVFHDDGTSISTSNGPNSFSDTESLISPQGSNHLLSPTMGMGMGMYNMSMGASTGGGMHVAPPVTSRAAGAKKFSFDNFEANDNNNNDTDNNDNKADEKGHDEKYDDDPNATITTMSTTEEEAGAKESNSSKFRVPGVPLGMKVNLTHSNSNINTSSITNVDVTNASLTAEAKLSAFESPRIPIPPSTHTQNGILIPTLNTHNNNIVSSGRRQWSPGRIRPQSAERRRWMARMSLLQQNHNNNNNRGDKAEAKVLEVMQGDENALAGGLGLSKYVHLEWLPWMGDDLPSGTCDEGDIKCPGCDRVLGSWAWNPHPRHTMNGRLDVPLIRVLRSVVCEAGLELDATPLTTPRTPRDEVSSTGNSSSNTPRSARSRPSSSTTPTRMSESK